MARYNKSGLTVQEAQEIFDKCIDKGGKSIRIKQGEYFGTWIIGNVGKLNAFYLFEEADGLVNVSYSTNPKTGITKKQLYYASKYGFINNDDLTQEKVAISRRIPLFTASQILLSVVQKVLPAFNNVIQFATTNSDNKVDKDSLYSCPMFQMGEESFYLVSLCKDDRKISVIYADKLGEIDTFKLSSNIED